MKKQGSPDTLLRMAVLVISFAVFYIAWCWMAKIVWSIEPPEGTSLTAVAMVCGQLFAGAGIQIFKKLGTAKQKELAAENKELKRQLTAASKQLDKIRMAVGDTQAQQK